MVHLLGAQCTSCNTTEWKIPASILSKYKNFLFWPIKKMHRRWHVTIIKAATTTHIAVTVSLLW